jgi:hypothetical protein
VGIVEVDGQLRQRPQVAHADRAEETLADSSGIIVRSFITRRGHLPFWKQSAFRIGFKINTIYSTY